MPSRRQSRVGDLLREELADLILREVRDPRLAEITSITHVDVAPDLSSARVHVSILGTEAEKAQTLQGLEAAASFLRRGLKERLDLRRIPLLAFVRDESIEGGARLLALMKEASSRESGGPKAGPASRRS
jgi:ribosome-binding factor A